VLSFAKRLRPAIIAGEITETLRFWHRPRVKVGQRYALEGGAVEVTRIQEIEISAITPEMARRQGFAGLVDLLKVAKHGSGERVFLIDFVYHEG
jgi:hypothetical protein